MAKVRANASGNWSSTNTGIWEVYDEQTNTWSIYGQNPTSDDDVYHNGYTLTLMMNVSVKSITNREDTNIGINAGGLLRFGITSAVGATFIAQSIDAYNASATTEYFSFIANSSNTECYVISPSIHIEGGYVSRHTYGSLVGFNITGYLYVKNVSLTGDGGTGTTHYFTLNGNIYGEGTNYFVYQWSNTARGWSFFINGSCRGVGDRTTNNLGVTIVQVTGVYRPLDNTPLTFSNASSKISLGSIEYYSTNGTYGFFTVNANNQFTSSRGFTIINPATFTWKDVTEPRSNSFVIVTDAEMNNHQQYPPANEVKEGTEYVWSEIVGTYQQPPEAVVLKDYVYDNDTKVGTLEIPQAPTTSDIVNAIKNDSDLGGKINTTNTNVGNISTAVTTIDGKVDIIDTNVDTLLSRLTSILTQRLGHSVTVEILQQILVAHLND